MEQELIRLKQEIVDLKEKIEAKETVSSVYPKDYNPADRFQNKRLDAWMNKQEQGGR